MIELVAHEVMPFDSGIAAESLVRTSDGRHIRITESARLLMEAVNGRTASEAAAWLSEHTGTPITTGEVDRLVDNHLRPLGLVSGSEAQQSRKSSGSRLGWHLPLLEQRSAAWVGRLFSVFFKAPLPLIVLVAYVGVIVAYFVGGYFHGVLYMELPVFPTIFLIVPSFVLHEVGHAAAAAHYGCSPRRMGVGLYLARPVLYCDLTETWRLTRWQRIVTDLGGVYFQALYQVPVFLLLVAYPSRAMGFLFFMLLTATVVNLNPLLKLDGYWITCDYLGISNFSRNAFLSVKSLFVRRHDSTAVPRQEDRRRTFVIRAYALLYVITTSVMLVILIVSLPMIIEQLHEHLAAVEATAGNLSHAGIGTIAALLNELLGPALCLVYVALMASFAVRKYCSRLLPSRVPKGGRTVGSRD